MRKGRCGRGLCPTNWRDTTPCRLIYCFDPFGGECCFHLQGSLMHYFEMLALAWQSTRGHILVEGNLHQHRCDNLSSRREMLQRCYYLTWNILVVKGPFAVWVCSVHLCVIFPYGVLCCLRVRFSIWIFIRFESELCLLLTLNLIFLDFITLVR
jgi:hypothetical protein